MISTLYQIIRTARVRQWLKNFSLFAAPVFSGLLFSGDTFTLSLKAFFAFCAVSSGSYFVNDIVDVPKDQLHPIKKNRPIASGKLSIKLAKTIAVLLLAGSLAYSYCCVGRYFFFALLSYLLMQLAYSYYFRNVIILDSLVVATGFVIRVFAGAFASNTSVSSWLALTTIGISMLLAFGKRRSEKTLLQKYYGEDIERDTRKTLRHYPDSLLDSMISMSATYAIITYSLFTFHVSPRLSSKIIIGFLPSVLRNPKIMMITIPLVIYGVARYLYIIYEKKEGESPERLFLSDKPMLSVVSLWAVFTLLIMYVLPLFT
ncbi:decaprenyl-phosphate phosphoribosyltransferase [Patescibacteria group bacterium]|nr:decaprenyl-phosphate phosphoribosyltransferase [Patescibacteria group bacterium]